jgi:hypothetical protein
MAKRAQNEGVRMLDDFVCDATHDPSIPLANLASQGRNEGMAVVAEIVIGVPQESETEGKHSAVPPRCAHPGLPPDCV